MSLFWIIAWFVVGLLLILGAAESMIVIAKSLAYKWKLSPLFVALAVVALGTNLPEFTVLLSAIASGDPGLALGNIVGSNISNVALILGLGILLGKPRIGTTKTPRNAQLMLFITVLFMLLRWSDFPAIFQGLVLASGAALIFISQYFMAVRGRTHEDKKFLAFLKRAKRKPNRIQGRVQYFVLGLSIVALALGGKLVVESSHLLADYFQVSTTIIGLTLVAVSTSLPELITIVVASIQGEDKISVGTIVGSNIYNLGLFASILLFMLPVSVLSTSDTIFLIVSTMMATGLILWYKGREVPRWIGLIFLAVFFLFVFQVIIP